MPALTAKTGVEYRPVLHERNTGRRVGASVSRRGDTGRVAEAGAGVGAGNAAALFASVVASRVEGGRAGIVRPTVRRELMRAAGLAGLRAFDATLIIALVQDRARRGESLAGVAADPRLAVVGGVGGVGGVQRRQWRLGGAGRAGRLAGYGATAVMTVGLAAVLFSGVVGWLAGA